MASSSSSSSSSVNPQRKKYDAFISFRGADIRDGFLSHLYEALNRKQICTFKDENLDRGEEISPALLKTIENSMVSIVIFSENYAFSPWCLDELVKILECQETTGHIVLPVFYQVDPTDVQELTGRFGDALAQYKEKFKENVESWSRALKGTANISGWDSRAIKPESKLVDKIVIDVRKKINQSFLSVYDNEGLFGIDSRVKEVESLLCLESEDVRMVGIWGMPGIGEDEERVKNTLDCCGFFPEIGISCLLDKCLVTTTRNEKLQMHDLLQQMGKDIVCEEKKPRKRSRLWNAKDICDILTKEKVAESVEAISLDLSKIRKTELYPSCFEKFDKLRLLKFYNPCSEEIKLHLPKGLKFLSNELRFLYWDQYPLKYLPSKFCPENLVELHMQSSQLKQLGNKDAPCFENLKFMDLSNSKQLIRIPNLSKFPKLEVIILRGCTSLVEVSSSTKYHGKIIDLDLGKCSKLASLPNSICNLKSLKELDFTDCVNLHGLPENLGDLESLVVLRATRSGLARLWRLSLKGCGISEIPSNLGSLGSLVYLHLSGNNFRSIPTSIKQCSMLTSLDLRDCKRLQFLPELPSGLMRLFAENCTSLESVSSSFIQGYMNSCLMMDLSKCNKLDQSASSQLMECLLLKLQSIGQPEEQCLDKEADATNFCWSDLLCIPGSEMPEWMMYENDNGSSLSFSLTTHSHASDFIKIAFCALVEANCSNFILDGISISCEGRFVTESGECLEMYPNCPLNLIPKIHYISLWYCAIRFNSKKIRIREASFQFFIPGGEVHKCGVHLMFDHNLEHDNVDDDSKRMSLPVLDYRQAMKQGLFFTQFLVAEDDPEQYPLQRLKERHEFKVVDLNFSLSFLFTLVICLAATSDQTKAQPTRMIFTLMLIYVCMRLLSFNSSLSLHGMPN